MHYEAINLQNHQKRHLNPNTPGDSEAVAFVTLILFAIILRYDQDKIFPYDFLAKPR